jgi:hypothetical protein
MGEGLGVLHGPVTQAEAFQAIPEFIMQAPPALDLANVTFAGGARGQQDSRQPPRQFQQPQGYQQPRESSGRGEMFAGGRGAGRGRGYGRNQGGRDGGMGKQDQNKIYYGPANDQQAENRRAADRFVESAAGGSLTTQPSIYGPAGDEQGSTRKRSRFT